MKTLLVALTVVAILGIAVIADSNLNGRSALESVDSAILADNNRKERRDDRQGDRDEKQDCRQEEGRIGDDKRECKHEDDGEAESEEEPELA
jgi:hypothetical protein